MGMTARGALGLVLLTGMVVLAGCAAQTPPKPPVSACADHCGPLPPPVHPAFVRPPPPAPLVEYRPPPPGGPDPPVWIKGRWVWNDAHAKYVWHHGHWRQPPTPTSIWIEPHWEGTVFVEGHWS